MTVKKQPDGRYLVMVRPHGRAGKNIRRIVNTKSEGVRLERELLSMSSADLDGSKLSDLVSYWYDHFGINLKDGLARKGKLSNIVSALGDCTYRAFSSSRYISYRTDRLASGISKNTCNHDLAYLKTVFNKLVKVGVLSENKLVAVSPLKFEQVDFSYLTLYEVKKLLVWCRRSRNESLFPVVITCLSTGARWGEIESLRFSQLDNGGIRLTKTKSLKPRTVPLDSGLYDYLLSRKTYSVYERVFANCYDAFANAIKNARISLPRGQLTHVLRHTFASHYVIQKGSIFDLQKILGHSDPRVTMRYAHLARDHLQDAVTLNPIAQISG